MQLQGQHLQSRHRKRSPCPVTHHLCDDGVSKQQGTRKHPRPFLRAVPPRHYCSTQTLSHGAVPPRPCPMATSASHRRPPPVRPRRRCSPPVCLRRARRCGSNGGHPWPGLRGPLSLRLAVLVGPPGPPAQPLLSVYTTATAAFATARFLTAPCRVIAAGRPAHPMHSKCRVESLAHEAALRARIRSRGGRQEKEGCVRRRASYSRCAHERARATRWPPPRVLVHKFGTDTPRC